MIELEMSQFFALILISVAALAGGCVGWDHLQDWRAAKAVRRNTVRCRICGASYRREGESRILRCPDCGTPNRRGRDRRLG